MLDVIPGQLQNIHQAEASFNGRRKPSFFEPSTELRMARLCDCWRCTGRGSGKGCLYGAVEIGEAAERLYWAMDMWDIYLIDRLGAIVEGESSEREGSRCGVTS